MALENAQVVLREAAAEDHSAVAEICRANRRAVWGPQALVSKVDRLAVVATVDGEVVGVAKTHLFEEPDGDAPAGHYLCGIEVAPQWRRHGLGSRLTRSRLEWIWERSDRAFFFTNEHNSASIGLHRGFGFTPISIGPTVRGVSADDGLADLILYEAVRPALASSAQSGR
ncbi:GNAT family N-acetyltransferase [Cellulomonas sp. P22]|uniref:GNAT family N-acetyltransferase n=1 Tax=Cellulomonas sp. P22 TaxID=3373189 RepID=UPI0037A79AC5